MIHCIDFDKQILENTIKGVKQIKYSWTFQQYRYSWNVQQLKYSWSFKDIMPLEPFNFLKYQNDNLHLNTLMTLTKHTLKIDVGLKTSTFPIY